MRFTHWLPAIGIVPVMLAVHRGEPSVMDGPIPSPAYCLWSVYQSLSIGAAIIATNYIFWTL